MYKSKVDQHALENKHRIAFECLEIFKCESTINNYPFQNQILCPLFIKKNNKQRYKYYAVLLYYSNILTKTIVNLKFQAVDLFHIYCVLQRLRFPFITCVYVNCGGGNVVGGKLVPFVLICFLHNK